MFQSPLLGVHCLHKIAALADGPSPASPGVSGGGEQAQDHHDDNAKR